MKAHFCILAIPFFIHHSIIAQTPGDTIRILQLNDVYEIGPLNQGRSGGWPG